MESRGAMGGLVPACVGVGVEGAAFEGRGAGSEVEASSEKEAWRGGVAVGHPRVVVEGLGVEGAGVEGVAGADVEGVVADPLSDVLIFP